MGGASTGRETTETWLRNDLQLLGFCRSVARVRRPGLARRRKVCLTELGDGLGGEVPQARTPKIRRCQMASVLSVISQQDDDRATVGVTGELDLASVQEL